MALNVQQINPPHDGSMAEVQVAHGEGFAVENGTLVVLDEAGGRRVAVFAESGSPA
jgi:hypothetical protein